jgi:hypothetical protein
MFIAESLHFGACALGPLTAAMMPFAGLRLPNAVRA